MSHEAAAQGTGFLQGGSSFLTHEATSQRVMTHEPRRCRPGFKVSSAMPALQEEVGLVMQHYSWLHAEVACIDQELLPAASWGGLQVCLAVQGGLQVCQMWVGLPLLRPQLPSSFRSLLPFSLLTFHLCAWL